MTVLVVPGADGAAVLQAFREEDPDLVVLSADIEVDEAVRRLTDLRPQTIVAAAPAAAPLVRGLQAALGQPDGLGDLPLDRAAQQVASDFQHDARDGQLYGVDLVSRDGNHASAGVYEHRVREYDGAPVLCQRLSMLAGDETAAALERCARAYLDRFGVRDGATCVELEWGTAGLQVLAVHPTPLAPAIPADAAFRAFGHSHQHLLAESVLREREFARRLVRPLMPGHTTLGVALLRADSSGPIRGAAGLRTLRRLTGFYSVTDVQPGTLAEAGSVVAVATFVHHDRGSVENSLIVVAEIEATRGLFAEDYEVIGLAPTAA